MHDQESTGFAEAEGIADRVRAFYDQHPYPPPVDSLEKYRQIWQDRERRRADFHVAWPSQAYREDHSILIAGCGTSQAAKHALRWPAARVTGIDFSATSVRFTEDLKRKYQLGNLEVHQLPLERVGELASTFDQIVCTGVLHHLADPAAGLQALRNVLRPNGAMHLMVYAPYGRTGVYMLQEFCKRAGVPASEAGIRDLVVALGALPPGHPIAGLLEQALDFRSTSGLADALLHPRDRAYSVPQLFELLATAGLSFARWFWQAPYDPHCGVMARIPQSERLLQLAPPEQYAAVELFRGTMLRHSVLAYRNDDLGPGPLGFSGTDWPGYVPIRWPDTVCVEDRLPPGMAAVLINPNHPYTDIVLPIRAQDKALIDAIDGHRSIGEIANTTGGLAASRALFERLYQHDQVVFDASRARSPQNS